jgi:hypothetical protein
MDLQRAEARAEGHVLGRRQAGLVTEHQHMVLEMGLVDAAEVVGVDRARQVQSDQLGAERAVEGRISKRWGAASRTSAAAGAWRQAWRTWWAKDKRKQQEGRPSRLRRPAAV